MFQTLNRTPFQAALTAMTDKDGVERAVVAVKATFSLPADGKPLRVAEKQLPIVYTDEYWGEPGKSSLKYPADLVLGKVGTDIGLIGYAYSYHEIPVKKLKTLLRVGPYVKEVFVIGNRKWQKRSFIPGFEMTPPIPFTKMALTFERAFGGEDKTHEKEKKRGYDRNNPVGTGYRLNDEAVEGHTLPNLENPTNLISNWKDKPAPACFGFIDGSWLPRVKYAGTYDVSWKKNQMPHLPQDFDVRFFNAASTDLCAVPFLQGGEPVALVNFSKRGAIQFTLPQISIQLVFSIGEERFLQKADLYTVLFEPDEERFSLVWGGTNCFGKQLAHMRNVRIETEGNWSELGVHK